MNRLFACQGRTGKLTAAVGDHLVDVHVELSAATRHPQMQWEHVVTLRGEYLVTNLNDQLMVLGVKPLAGLVRVSGGFLQNGVCANHLTRNEVFSDAEVLNGALALSVPQFLNGNLDLATAVSFGGLPPG
jgi:hypothetical protein